jgi:hypothetical protein
MVSLRNRPLSNKDTNEELIEFVNRELFKFMKEVKDKLDELEERIVALEP